MRKATGAGGLSGYTSATLGQARRLRREMTNAERALWNVMRAGHSTAKWRRQQPIGPYIADFVCQEARLIVEADGGQHSPEADAKRTAFLDRAGYRVIRFWNNDILANLEGVLIQIGEALAAAPSPTSARQLGEGATT